MGAVFRPKDLRVGWRKIARESIEDFSPDTKDSVIKIIDSWEGTKSEEKLKELLGHDKAESLIKKMASTKTTTKSKSTLTSDQQNHSDYIVTGETEEDVLRSAAEHDIKEHGKTKKDIVKLKEKLKGFICTIYY